MHKSTIQSVNIKGKGLHSGIEKHHGYWKIPAGSNQLSVCANTKTILGLKKSEEINFRSFFTLVEPQCRSVLKEWLRASSLSSIIGPIRIGIRLKGNAQKWLRISGMHSLNKWEFSEMFLRTVEDVSNYVDEERIALSIVNHELRNPLSVIRLYAQLLQKEDYVKSRYSTRDIASIILTHVTGITGLLEQYLSAPSDAAVQRLNYSSFDLNELINQIINEIKHFSSDRVFVRQSNFTGLIRADRYQIMQVLINYLTNAIKFSEECSRITISVNYSDTGVVVGVADQGSGIPAGSENRVFEKFYTVPHTNSGRTSRGLGLFLVKEIIEHHRGMVWVRRGDPVGTEFFFSLPSAIVN